MGETGPLFVLEVETGQGASGPLHLRAGRRLETISLGSQGHWVVTGPGVRDIHGYLAFDGALLFLRSANPAYPLRVDGTAVTGAWQPVEAPARISVGGVTLTYSAIGEDGSYTAAPDTQRPRDDEATRFQPVEIPPDDATRPGLSASELGAVSEFDRTRVNVEAPVPLPRLSAPLPAAGMPPPNPSSATVPLAFTPPAAPQHLGPILDLPPPRPPPQPAGASTGPTWRKVLDRVLVEWRQTSAPKKALLVLLPFAFVAVFILFDDPARQQAAPPSPNAASTGAMPSGSGMSEKASQPSPAPTPTPPASTTTVAVASTPRAMTAVQPGSRTRLTGPTAPSTSTSPERFAVDAVVAGAYAEAAQRYDELAREHPDQPAYREAARILRAKAKAGSP
jgi:hypothetical protein